MQCPPSVLRWVQQRGSITTGWGLVRGLYLCGPKAASKADWSSAEVGYFILSQIKDDNWSPELGWTHPWFGLHINLHLHPLVFGFIILTCKLFLGGEIGCSNCHGSLLLSTYLWKTYRPSKSCLCSSFSSTHPVHSIFFIYILHPKTTSNFFDM